MKRRLYIDGNTVYGIDDECLIKKRKKETNPNQKDLDALWERYQRETDKENEQKEHKDADNMY